MGLGILKDKRLDHVPGTVLLNDEAAHAEALTQGLKHGEGRNAHIVLNPQPSLDPNDPLNWSPWKKECITWILCFGAMLNSAVSVSQLNASLYDISLEINASLTDVVLTSGYALLVAGATGPFVCALSRKFGKRPLFLFSTIMTITGTAIGQSKKDYTYLLAARITQGFSLSTWESLTISAIGDLYYVHQRAIRVSAMSFILNAGGNLATILSGVVYQGLGFFWLFHLFQIFLVFLFLLLLFFVPETTYIRDRRYDTDTAVEEHLDEIASKRAQHEHIEELDLDPTASRVIPEKNSYLQSLAVYNGVYSKDNFIKLIIGPFITLFNPAASYSVLGSGLIVTGYVATAIVLAGIFSGPPWLFNAAQVGYVGAGPLIGGMIAMIITGIYGDWSIKYMTRLNKGVYEPEFRLIWMIPATIFSVVGFFVFGWALDAGESAVLCSFLQGVVSAGVLFGVYSTLAYGLDAFRHQSSEIFIMNMVAKNFLFYGLSTFSNNWVAASGARPIMYTFGGLTAGIAIFAIPVYIFGQQLRSWWTRHDLFVKFNMQSSGPGMEH